MKIFLARTFLRSAAGFFLAASAQRALFATETAQHLPAPANIKIDFDRDIRPILENSCLQCHGPQKPRSNFRLDYREGALAGGDDNTNDIVPGDSSHSRLIAYVARQTPDMEMPPVGKGTPLSPEQISLLRAWIDQGVDWQTTNEPPATVTVLEPVAGGFAVNGNQAKFREVEGTKEGGYGGVENFSTLQQISPEETVLLSGHLIAPDNDFGFQFAMDKNNLGFFHTGFEQWQKYYATGGGYDPTVIPSQFNFNNSLYVNNGHAWVELGLELPDWPEIIFGYEYRYQNGNEPTLDWGYDNGKNIYPATQKLDEQTHSLKLDITKNIDDWRLENLARVDFYTERNQGAEAAILFGGTTPDQTITTQDNYRQVQGMDTLTLEKQLQDWWFLNGGFYYSRLAGSDYFNQTTVIPVFSINNVIGSQQITLDRESEIFSVANLITPLNGLTLSVGTQNEWTQEKGFSESIPDLELGGTVPANSTLDEFKASQSAAIRFSKIPFTIVSGDALFSEDNYGIYQGEDTDELQRDTAAENFRYDLKTGFSTSPWEWGDLSMQYERQSSHTDYNQLQDVFEGIPGPSNGYPAFILDRTITSDQFEAKLALCPATWLKIMLTYQLSATEYSSKTDPAFDPVLAELVSAGGSIVDGHYNQQTYGISATLTPFRRFYLSGGFTYSHSRVTTADNGDPSIVRYDGDIFTFNGIATYALSDKTSLQLSYNLSHADYSENNAAAGIPAGLDYLHLQLLAGLTKRFTENLSGALRYGFSQYNEPSSGGASNFRANSIFGTLTCRF